MNIYLKLENIKVKLHPAQDIANENFVRRLNERKIPIMKILMVNFLRFRNHTFSRDGIERLFAPLF